MVLARYEVKPFAEREIELVQTFADQAAIAIENVRLFNETKEALDQQSAVAAVLGEISKSGFQLQPVLESVIGAATMLCAAQQGFIYRREGGVFRARRCARDHCRVQGVHRSESSQSHWPRHDHRTSGRRPKDGTHIRRAGGRRIHVLGGAAAWQLPSDPRCADDP